MPKNTGATNLDAIHNGGWCYVSPVTATCSEKSFRAELTAAFDPCLVPHQTIESYTEASARRLGDTSRINSPLTLELSVQTTIYQLLLG